MCVCVYSRIIIIVESAVRGKRKEGEEKERKKERKKDLTLERKKVVTAYHILAQKHTNFQFVFFLRCDFEEFLFTFQVCAPQRAEQKERERERERGRGRERARALTRSFSDTLSLIARVAGAL